jgi:uncharacterized membrane protein YtjA (UPF0391 family)
MWRQTATLEKIQFGFSQTPVKAETLLRHERWRHQREQKQEKAMGNLLYWAVVFLIVALVAAALGFGSVAGVAIEGARMLFWVAIVLFVVALVGGLIRRGGV